MAGVLNALLRIPDFLLEFALDLLLAACHGYRLPKCFADWVDRNMPKLGGVDSVSFCCCHKGDLPFGPLVNASGNHGLTLGEHVALAEDRCPFDPCDGEKVRTLLHELVHVEQYRTVPGMSLRYLLEILRSKIRHGLSANTDLYNQYEKEARRRARELTKKYVADNPCGCERLAEPPSDVAGGDVSNGQAAGPPVPAPKPHELTAPEVAALKAAGRCDRPAITALISYPGDKTQVEVRAASRCGIRKLRLELSLLSAGSGQTVALPPVEQSGGCPSFRVQTVRRALAPGALLQVDATAESCAGDSNTNRFLAGPP